MTPAPGRRTRPSTTRALDGGDDRPRSSPAGSGRRCSSPTSRTCASAPARSRRLFPHPLYAVKAFTSHADDPARRRGGARPARVDRRRARGLPARGVPASRVVLHGNNKTDDELALAVGVGVRLVNVDNARRARAPRAGRRGRGRACSRSCSAWCPRSAPAPTRRSGPGRRVEVRYRVAGRCPSRPSSDGLPHIEAVGIHAHIGSQVLDVEPYLARDRRAPRPRSPRCAQETGFVADIVDVGGGFGVALHRRGPAAPGRGRSGGARRACARVRRDRGLRVPHTIVEPGRSVVGQRHAHAVPGRHRQARFRRLARSSPSTVACRDNVRPMLYGAAYTVAFGGPPGPKVRPSRSTSSGGTASRVTCSHATVELPG